MEPPIEWYCDKCGLSLRADDHREYTATLSNGLRDGTLINFDLCPHCFDAVAEFAGADPVDVWAAIGRDEREADHE